MCVGAAVAQRVEQVDWSSVSSLSGSASPPLETTLSFTPAHTGTNDVMSRQSSKLVSMELVSDFNNLCTTILVSIAPVRYEKTLKGLLTPLQRNVKKFFLIFVNKIVQIRQQFGTVLREADTDSHLQFPLTDFN